MKQRNRNLVIPYFVSMAGCVDQCIYCNQSMLKEHGVMDNVEKTVVKYLQTFQGKPETVELAFFGGTFLNIHEKRMQNLLYEARKLKDKGLIDKVRISTTPDSITEKRCKDISNTVNTVELGIQTLNDRLLKLLRRNYSRRECHMALNILKDAGFKIGLQLMVGLPMQSFYDFVDTVEHVCMLKPDFVRIYPLVTLKTTPLHTYEALKIVDSKSLDLILQEGAYALFAFYKENIKVVRVGLTEFIKKDDIYHGYMLDNWREEMESLCWREFLKHLFQKQLVDNIEICCSRKDYMSIVGIKKKNLAYFAEQGKKIKISFSDDIPDKNILVNSKNYNLFQMDWTKISL